MVIKYGHYGSDPALPVLTLDHQAWSFGETSAQGWRLTRAHHRNRQVFSGVTSWGSLMEIRAATSFPLRHLSDTSGRRHYPRKRIPRYSSPVESRKPSWTLRVLYTLWDRPR